MIRSPHYHVLAVNILGECHRCPLPLRKSVMPAKAGIHYRRGSAPPTTTGLPDRV
jgi:hypothetical protein